MRPTEFLAAVRKGKRGPAYFFRGPDRFLHEECRRALVSSIPPDARAWCLAEIEFQAGCLERELQSAQQMPMLGGRSFLLFSDPEDFKHASDEDYETLQAYLEHPSPFATVVFVAAEPDRRRRFIQSLDKRAEVVDMLPLGKQEGAAWARDYLRQAGVDIAPGLAEELVAKFESSSDSPGEHKKAGVNLLWLRTELDKLLTAKPGVRRLEPDDLDLVVTFREEHVVGKLLRAIAERKCGEGLGHLRALLGSKVAETLLVWCIADLFRQALKGAADAGYGRGAWYRTGNPFASAEIVPIVVRRYRREELLQALRLVRRADLSIKSSWKDSKILLEFLVWQIIVGKGSETAAPLGDEVPVPSAE